VVRRTDRSERPERPEAPRAEAQEGERAEPASDSERAPEPDPVRLSTEPGGPEPAPRPEPGGPDVDPELSGGPRADVSGSSFVSRAEAEGPLPDVSLPDGANGPAGATPGEASVPEGASASEEASSGRRAAPPSQGPPSAPGVGGDAASSEPASNPFGGSAAPGSGSGTPDVPVPAGARAAAEGEARPDTPVERRSDRPVTSSRPSGFEAPIEPDLAEAAEESIEATKRTDLDGVKARPEGHRAGPTPEGTAAAATRTAEASSPRVAPEAQAPERAAPPRADLDRTAEILRQVRLHVSSERKQALIELEPKHLGRIAVRMALRDGRMTAVLQVERPETLRALERQIPELKAALGAQNIETESFDMMLGFDHGEAGAGEGQGRSSKSHSDARFSELFDEPGDAVEPESALARRVAGESGIDTYV